MSSNLPVVFNFGNQSIRTIDREGEIWFVASDVCAALELSNPSAAVSRLDEDERSMFNIAQGNTLSSNEGIPGRGNPNTSIINESGLYSLVMSSRKAEAKKFKRWVTHEVLPAIRKTGGYQTEGDYQSPADRLNGDPRYYSEIRQELFDFVDGLNPKAWPNDQEKRQRLADAYLTDMLVTRRWLLSFDHRGQVQMTSVNRDSCIIDTEDERALMTMVRESVPLHLLPSILEVANERIRNALKSNLAKYQK